MLCGYPILQKKLVDLISNLSLFSFYFISYISFQIPKLQDIDWIMIERIMISELPQDLEGHTI